MTRNAFSSNALREQEYNTGHSHLLIKGSDSQER